jgi:hypothetical protein
MWGKQLFWSISKPFKINNKEIFTSNFYFCLSSTSS